MDQDLPSVYILHGEDEFALAQDLAGMDTRFDDPGL